MQCNMKGTEIIKNKSAKFDVYINKNRTLLIFDGDNYNDVPIEELELDFTLVTSGNGYIEYYAE